MLYFAWIVALVSTAGSLYFSEVLGFAPCILCWYQRIAMYPLVLIIGIGIATKDTHFYRYALPLAIMGAGFAFYQNLLYYNIIPERLAPCVSGISCITRYIKLLGFADIPLLSLVSFIIIITSLIGYKKLNHD